MKTKLTVLIVTTLTLLMIQNACAQGTTFTYQGRLADNSALPNGTYDMRFRLYDTPTVGTGIQVGSDYVAVPVPVANGLFTTNVDFGSGPFLGGSPRFLEIGVRTNGNLGAYTILGPRQPLTPTPYAIRAGDAGTLGGQAATAYVAKAGDTMTGTLNLPANGLTVGTSQLVVSPTYLLDVLASSASQGLRISRQAKTSQIFLNIADSDYGYFDLGGGTVLRGGTGGGVGSIFGGNVGIGTPNPQDLLHVNGNLRWGGTAVDYVYSGEDGTGLFLEQRGSSSGKSKIRFQSSKSSDSSNYSQFFMDPYNGFSFRGLGSGNANVGIGTLTPSYNLEVMGTANVNGGYLQVQHSVAPQLYFYSPQQHQFLLRSDGVYPGSSLSIREASLGAPGTSILTIHSRGNVGIGNSDPQWPLDIQSSGQAVIRLVSANHINGSVIELKNTSASQDLVGAINFNDAANGFPGQIAFSAAGVMSFRASSVSVPVLTITGGSDLAEPFQMSSKEMPKGAVAIIDEENPGKLKLSERAYDMRVAGILSGANGINPGITLHKEGVLEGGENVALSGRVYALADASHEAIKPGDLLTTSDTPGHCMKVTNHAKAQGAIIGKAMSALKEGKGMVLVLVSLQ